MQTTLLESIDEVRFPGSHCLEVKLQAPLRIRTLPFKRDTKTSEAGYAQWIAGNSQGGRGFSLSIPPMSGNPLLPRDLALLTFAPHHEHNNNNNNSGCGGGDPSSGSSSNPNNNNQEEEVWVDCSVIFFRRDEEDTSQRIFRHLFRELVPVLRCLRGLVVPPFDSNEIIELAILSLCQFYATVDPSLMAPFLRQRIYSMEADEFFGHICASCGFVGANRRSVRLSARSTARQAAKQAALGQVPLPLPLLLRPQLPARRLARAQARLPLCPSRLARAFGKPEE